MTKMRDCFRQHKESSKNKKAIPSVATFSFLNASVDQFLANDNLTMPQQEQIYNFWCGDPEDPTCVCC